MGYKWTPCNENELILDNFLLEIITVCNKNGNQIFNYVCDSKNTSINSSKKSSVNSNNVANSSYYNGIRTAWWSGRTD